MLNQRHISNRHVTEKSSVGSLFIPTRSNGLQRSTEQGAAARDTAARIAGLQRQPVADDLGILAGEGLILPGQHWSAPVQPVVVSPSAVKPRFRLSWAGSGIYFWWQLGAVQYLLNHFCLDKVPMVGASGGGLAAVLATCGVEPEEVMESAYKLSKEYKIWDKPLGLLGCWGQIIEEWLYELLPDDAAERCKDQVSIVVTQLPFCNQVAISDFQDKRDLVNVAMASAHVPLFLDWKASRLCRGVQCVDGSFPDFFTGANCDFLTCSGNAVVFDYFDDPNIVRNGRMDMLELKEFKKIKKIILLGYRFAQRKHEEGEFDRFDMSGMLKQRF